jgi:hypothetical protein
MHGVIASESCVVVPNQEPDQLRPRPLVIFSADREHVALAAAQFPNHLVCLGFTRINPVQITVLRAHPTGLRGVKLLVNVHLRLSGGVNELSLLPVTQSIVFCR